jgi:hypothetical protein
MNPEAKISPAFEEFLAEAGPNDKREAIIVLRTASSASDFTVRGRLRALRQRLRDVETRAAAQRPLQEELFDSYQKASAARVYPRTSTWPRPPWAIAPSRSPQSR